MNRRNLLRAMLLAPLMPAAIKLAPETAPPIKALVMGPERLELVELPATSPRTNFGELTPEQRAVDRHHESRLILYFCNVQPLRLGHEEAPRASQGGQDHVQITGAPSEEKSISVIPLPVCHRYTERGFPEIHFDAGNSQRPKGCE